MIIFFRLKNFPAIHGLHTFYHERMLTFVKCFSAPTEMIIYFFPLFFNGRIHMNTIHMLSQHIPGEILLDDDVLSFDLISKYFVQDFAFMKNVHLSFSFLLNVFIRFWYQLCWSHKTN